jgi:hypothetical protein
MIRSRTINPPATGVQRSATHGDDKLIGDSGIDRRIRVRANCMRFMRGKYIALDGRVHHGTFGFI